MPATAYLRVEIPDESSLDQVLQAMDDVPASIYVEDERHGPSWGEVRDALRRASTFFAGAHVNAGTALGRVYVELEMSA